MGAIFRTTMNRVMKNAADQRQRSSKTIKPKKGLKQKPSSITDNEIIRYMKKHGVTRAVATAALNKTITPKKKKTGLNKIGSAVKNAISFKG